MEVSLIKVLLHSFFIQSGWSYERRQALGFFYSMYPMIENLPGRDREEKKKLMLRHLQYFNTNPYVANLILGVVCGLERENISGEVINSVKEQLSGPLAIIGDNLFFYTLLPLLSVVSLYIYTFYPENFLLPAIFLLCSYNVIHLLLRIVGFYYGIRYSFNAVRFLQGVRLHNILFFLKVAGLVLVIVFIITNILPSSPNMLFFVFKILYCGIMLSLQFFNFSTTEELFYLTVLALFVLNFAIP